jgi:hypothetical protein
MDDPKAGSPRLAGRSKAPRDNASIGAAMAVVKNYCL